MSSKKIAIIGAGWLGCHMAYKLKSKHNITLFDYKGIFSGSSYFNQNRLHEGFHYSRNQKTRKLCRDTFNLFIRDYPHLISDIKQNNYVIPEDNSLIDYGTFKNIFMYEQIDFVEQDLPDFHKIEGNVIVNEKYIDPVKSKIFFQKELNDIFILKTIDETALMELSKNYDYVINVTNNQLQPLPNHYFELSLTLIYDKISTKPFGSVTMVDGPFFSIYPYRKNQYTITDVENTPMYVSKQFEDIQNFKIHDSMIELIKSKIEHKISYYYEQFSKDFLYNSYYTAVKVKRNSQSADRSPIIIKDNNIITCVTGKIQGIYTLEKFINDEIINR